jgi:type VI secretion system secreted protein VgrG
MARASIELTVEGVKARFDVTGCVVEEALERPFVARLECVTFVGTTPSAAADLGLIGKRATLRLRLHDGDRSYVGMVEGVRDDERRSSITVAARIGWLEDTRDYRVFVSESAKSIVEAVLFEHGLRVEWRARRTPAKRAQCVQGFESDLAFVTRLLAEEGMCWYPKSADGDVIRVSDVGGTFVDLELTLPYREEAGLEVGRAVHGARLVRRVVSDQATLRDYDFTHPNLALEGRSGQGGLEWYEYPGRFDKPADGKELAAIRLGELAAEHTVLEGGALAPEVQAGGVFSLEGAPLEAENGRWLVIAARHEIALREGAGELAYAARFRAVPADRGYRPARAAEVRRGVTTGDVTGAAGKEIHIDGHGRVRALLRWERRKPADETASADLRVMQNQMAGAVMHPRVGWEQLVAHSDPLAETPFVLGRIYNGRQRPPAPLPANKVETHFGTLSTSNGTSGNFTRISDKAGSEGIHRNAAKDFREKTKNDKLRKVGKDDKKKVGNKRKRTIKDVRLERVDGEQRSTITGPRSLDVYSNCWVTASAQIATVGAARLFQIGGDYITQTPLVVRIVGGAKAELGIEQHLIVTHKASLLRIGGSKQVAAGATEMIGVAGLSRVKIDGAKTVRSRGYQLKVRGPSEETLADLTVEAKGKIVESYRKATFELKATKLSGSEVAFEAADRIILKTNGCVVTITNGTIVINGQFEGTVGSVEEGNHKYG